MEIAIEPLGGHDRAAFSCGVSELDEWFPRRAGQDQKRHVSRVFVAVDPTQSVVGFYSLSSFAFSVHDLPEGIARKLPRCDAIPGALIGRLARHVRVRGHGIGELLVADAIHRVLEVRRSLAVFAIVVDAKNDRAAAFYRGFGFRPFPLRQNRLFLPTSTAAAGLTST